jgi:hypothetical protein
MDAPREAYNRQIDIEVQPADLQTTRSFPHQANDADLLMQPGWPSLQKVIDAQQTPTAAGVNGAQ